ncbi:hypothetical protein EV193_11370 [Herbihabitans rhizosphaerae]|uniref:UPF0182 protein EV193_11370 n=1 Tax=Herbihabitans rhizosphaerae TaxID=1872711 RepID=A0A4Q7KFC6_9PSEU|nr:UPF0182 family protein [Herbihabitans rhizosphaerae]RZS32226.1 hypothetical protein EV193_11370 [Herbihabitans rhizosphaerae]
MATRPPIGMPRLSRRSRILLIIAATVAVVLLVGARLLDAYVDWQWFGEVGFRGVFTTVLWTRIALFFSVGILVGGLLAISLIIAYRTRPVFVPVAGADDPLARYRSTIVARVRLFGIGIPVLAGVASGAAAQGDWQIVQMWLNATPFGVTDPEFGNDIGFYAFKLPFYTWLISWGFIAIAVAFAGAAVTHYIFGGIRLAGKGGQLTGTARMQLSITAGVFVLVYAIDYFFERYELLFSERREDLFNGATYTDLNAVLPAKLILTFIAVFCAVAFFVGGFLRNLQLPAIATVLLVLSSVLIGVAWPLVLEQFSVKPNANEKEAKSIQRAMDATKQAYGLGPDKVTMDEYPGNSTLQPSEVRASNPGTLDNIRLLDPSILETTFTQLRAQENFYGFPDKLDVDRYTVNGKKQDYIVAAREINTAGLAENQRSWINQHLVYTHGNGFVAAQANTTEGAYRDNEAQGGYPRFTVSDLNAQNSGVPMPIPVNQPRIYYGELATSYAIVGGDQAREFDLPGKSFKYDGKGGIPIDGFFDKLIFAAYETEQNILFNSAVGEGSRIMYHRDPRDRVSKVAPWLTVDGDPYPAVVDGRIQWIVDGYTTLEHYPYSRETPLGSATSDSLSGVARQADRPISYIRNSVKATVDAYDGSVNLFRIDEQDPVLKAWTSVFPGVVKPLSEAPAGLREHFRYPEDLFKVQRELLSRYHVDKPQEFFGNEQFWNVPPDPTKEGGTVAGSNAAKQPPYYVYAQTPGQNEPKFQLTSALVSLRREFLAAWMTVSSEPEDYGKIRVLRLPNGLQVDGPVQVQNRFNSTSEVTQQRTFFQNSNTMVLSGNLLTLPVSGSLLYVEPMYIQQRNDKSFPQLARVLVSYNGRVGFAATIDEALNRVFGTAATPPTTPPPGTPPGTPPTSQPPPPGVTSPELEAAKTELLAAVQKLRQVTKGDWEGFGKAMAAVDAAGLKVDQVQARLNGTPPAGQTPAPPTTTAPRPPG